MDNVVKIALIGAVAVIAALALVSYNSPYQTCVRAATAEALKGDFIAQKYGQQRAEKMRAYERLSGDYVSEAEKSVDPPMTDAEAKRRAQLLCSKAG